MEFGWVENKNVSNFEKHHIRFENVTAVFDDPQRLTSPDLRLDYGEDRFKTVGEIYGSVAVSVIFTVREHKIRLISARIASKNERLEYINESGLKSQFYFS